MNNRRRTYRLASKFDGDWGRMVLQFPNGEFIVVMEVRFPHDGQIRDNFELMQAAEDLMRKRINKSI